MHDIADFLVRHPPFDTLDEQALENVAASTEIEFHAARAPILDSAEATSEFAYVVRRGAVELLVDGRLLDVLGEGEMFGFASLLTHDPLGFVARAAEDTLVYRIPADAIRPVLERPAAVPFVARAMDKGVRLLAGHGERPEPTTGGRQVRELIRATPLVCSPDTSVQEAAQGMVDAGVTCAVVELGDGLGIVTDRDIRTRVVAAGAGPDTPLTEVMSAPAWTVPADRTGTEALLTMLDHGVRHLPVLDSGRRLIGVLDDVDLMASERRAPFRLRAAIARGETPAEVAAAAARAARQRDGAARRRAALGGDQPGDRRHPRQRHAPADRPRARGARPGRRCRSRGWPRAASGASSPSPARTWTAPWPGTARATTRSSEAGCGRSPSGCSTT